MSLEDKIGELIDALNANTEALKAAGGAAHSGKPATEDNTGDKPTGRGGRGGRRGASPDEAPTTKYTAEQVKAAAVKVKDELGTPAAKKLIKKHGADELAKLDPSVYGDFIADCEKALKGDDGGDDGGL